MDSGQALPPLDDNTSPSSSVCRLEELSTLSSSSSSEFVF